MAGEIIGTLVNYGWLVAAPIFGGVFGKEIVVNIMIFVLFQAVLSSFLQKSVGIPKPVCQGTLLIVYLIQPFNLIPGFVTWTVAQSLWLSEPLWQFFEVVGAVHIIMKFNEVMRESRGKFDDSAQSNMIMPMINALAWGGVVWFAGCIYFNEEISFFAMCGAGIMIGAMLAFWFLIRAIFGSGPKPFSGLPFHANDVAMIAMCCMGLMYSVAMQKAALKDPIKIDKTLQKAVKDSSILALGVKVLINRWDGLETSLSFLWYMASPWFIMSVFLRICCMLCLVDVALYFAREATADSDKWEKEKADIERTEDPFRYVNSSILQAILCIVYSQFLVHHIQTYWYVEKAPFILRFVTAFLPHLRTCQAIGMLAYYAFRVARRPETAGHLKEGHRQKVN